jgi:fibronectin type 3 domain-containing protein/uncharacterized membrane protein
VGRTGTLRRLAALSIAACATVLLPATASAAPTAKAAAGIGPVGHVSVGLLMTRGGRHKPARPETMPLRVMNPAALRKAKLAASVAPATSTSTAATSSAAPFNGLNSPGLSAADEGDQPTPPDTTGAIGPTRYVEAVNQLVGVYDRTNLSQLSSTDLGTFTGTPSSLATSDPQMQWDPQGNRWFYAGVAFNSGFTTTYVLFGWSMTADPSDLTGGWCRYAIPTGSNIPDYPKLGHDANYVMVGDNVYDGSKSSLPFVTADIWAIPKPSASQTTCSGTLSATHFADANHLLKNADGTLAFTPIPANTQDGSANGFIVAAHDPSSGPQSKAMVWHMTAGPVLVPNGDISVGSKYSVPPSVPQPGTSYLVDSLDGRFTQAVALFDPTANAEAVWTQHTVAGSSRSVVRWYEFLPGSLSIRQQGTLASSTDYYWNAAISPSSVGSDAMISYNRGSGSLLSLIGAQTRTSSTPLGQMDAGEVVLGQSSAADQETLFQGNCTSNPCRWGDYSGATPDPLNPGVVWGSNQIDGPTFFGYAQWQTQNFAITTGGAPPAPPGTPTGLVASGIDTSSIGLTWNPASGATSYKVQRSPDGSTGWTQVGTSTTTTFTDTGLAAATTYYYRVLASNNVGDSSPSNVASARTAVSIPFSQSPQGSWVGVYGADGSALLGWNGGDLVSIPNASLSVDQGQRFIWQNPSSDVRALQSPDASTREATCAYDANQVKIHVTFTAAYTGTIHVYAVDFDSLGRRETITINDGSGPQTATLSSDFSQGAWVNASISVAAGGTVSVTVNRTAGMNGVVSGIVFGGAPPAPPPPTGLAAAALNSSQVTLTWNAVSGATGYQVQRSPDGSTGWSQVGTSTTTSFVDSWLIPSTTYYYRVTATNGPAISGPSNVASATTSAGLPTSQSPQGSWVGVYGVDGSALLGWNGGDLVSIPNASLSVDQGQRFIFSNPSTDVRALQSPDGTTREATCAYDANQVKVRITFSAAYSGVIHVYALDFDSLGRRETITVNDGSGPQTANLNSDFSQGAWVNTSISVAAGGTVSVTVTRTAGINGVISGIFFGGAPPAPPAPTGLSASALNSSQISLTWNAVGGATGYKVQRSPDGSTGWTQVGTSTTASFTDSWLIPSTTYFYSVTASNGPASSAPSNVASATTPAGLPTSQSPQGNWVGVFGADGSALLGWNGGDLVSIPNASFSVDQGQRFVWQNPSSDVRGLQSPDASAREATCAYDANQVKVHITFSSAYSGTIHVYAVDFDSLGRRETITINDGSGPQTANLNGDFSQGAWVTASISVAAGGTVNVTVTRMAGINAVVSGIVFGGVPPAPAAPTGLAASPLNSSQVSLSWNAVSGATGYKIQRSPDGSTGWTQVGTTTTTGFVDSWLIPSTTYFYRVTASNGPSSSTPSNVASATTPAGLPIFQSPQGTWVGVYGASGSALLGWNGGDLVSIPNATFGVDQGQRFIWQNPSSDVRGLQSPDASTREATCAYDGNQVKIHITFSTAYSGTIHVYAVDFDSLGRRETITINDGGGPQTANLSSDFSQGAWVNTSINVAAGGTVTVTVTRTAGVNAVVSGVFLG